MKQADKERLLQEVEQALFRFNRLLIDLKPEKHQHTIAALKDNQEVAEMLESGTPLSTLETKEFIKDVNNIWSEFYPS
jgi:hypothetical protein